MGENCKFEQKKYAYEELRAEMNDFLSSADGSSFNICACLYDIIQKGQEEDKVKLFEDAVILYEYIESNDSVAAPVSILEANKSALKDRYGDIVNSFIDFFVQQKSSCDIFYQNMWNTIQNDMFFPDHAAKTFAFYYILIDRRIPYFELTEGYLMENDAFKRLYHDYAEEVCKIRYILSTGMKQKTERASLVLKELGLDIPDSDASAELVAEYEKKLIIMVEALKGQRKSSGGTLGSLLSKLQDLSE